MIGPKTIIGARPHWVQLQNPGPAIPDGDGGFTQTWADLEPAHAHAEIKPATAKDLERVASGTVLSTASHVITFGYHPGVTVATRIVFRGRIFSVTGVSTPEERHVETICVCVELLGQAVPGVGEAWMQTDWAQAGWTQDGTIPAATPFTQESWAQGGWMQ